MASESWGLGLRAIRILLGAVLRVFAKVAQTCFALLYLEPLLKEPALIIMKGCCYIKVEWLAHEPVDT